MVEALTRQAQAVLASKFRLENASVAWRRPEEATHGDIATAVALEVAKDVEERPRKVAEALAEALRECAGVERCAVAGPGYVNVWWTADALLKELGRTRSACTAKVKRKEAPVIVEYSQPNIAKPLGAHHLLTTVVGQAIVNLYRHAGFDVVAWNYIGDWGTQFGKLAVAEERWGDGRSASQYTLDELLALYVRFHEEAESDPALDDEAREAFRRLEQGDCELRAFWRDVVSVTKDALSGIYERLHVSFDRDEGESFYEDKMQPLLKEGIEKGVFAEGEGGALIVPFPEGENLPPSMVRKSDGSTLYATRDLAQMRFRIDTLHPQAIYIVTDIAQQLYFRQLVKTCEQLRWTLPPFENVLVGRMRFKDRAMSTRRGTALKLEDVLDEAVRRADDVIAAHGEEIQTDEPVALAEMMGIGAVAYGILSQKRTQDLVFDLDRFLNLEGNSAPYLQYTHARARSVLRRAGLEGGVGLPAKAEELVVRERVLINVLLQFAAVLEEARATRMPHLLAHYLFELCREYNAFYAREPILKSPEPARSLRLALTDLTATVLKTGAEILTIRVPDTM